MVNYNYTKSKS